MTTDVYDDFDIEGYIGIQHHGEKECVYRFRNLRIKELGVGGEVFYPHRTASVPSAAPSFTSALKLEGNVYEAEAADAMQGCSVATNQPGFQGKGFADYSNAGSYIEWRSVNVDTAGTHTLTFRYGGGANRPCNVLVNGKSIGRVPFSATGDWRHYTTASIKADLQQGANTVRVVAIGDGPKPRRHGRDEVGRRIRRRGTTSTPPPAASSSRAQELRNRCPRTARTSLSEPTHHPLDPGNIPSVSSSSTWWIQKTHSACCPR